MMKVELLKNLLLEEIRLHSELRGTKSFVLYPIVILITTAIASYLLLNYSNLIGSSIAQICIMIFFSFGIISGTFGLNASNYLERRFGDFGKLFSNALLLPIKLGNIFFMTAISDSIFYFGWFILPIFGGGALGLIFSNITLTPLFGLFISSGMAFLLGISISFLLTVLLTKSLKKFFVLLIIIFSIFTIGFTGNGIDFFPSYYLYRHLNLLNICLHILLITLLLLLTSKLIGNEYNSIRHKSKYKSFTFKEINHYFFKDIIDLYRTHGLIAKPLFNVLIPSAILLVLFSSLNILEGELTILTKNMIFIAILLGTLSVNFFNVIISGDSISYYVFLPSSLKDFVRPKMIITEIICTFQGTLLLLIYAYINSSFDFLFASFFILIGFIYYTISLNFYLNGLKPNENSLNLNSLLWMGILYLPLLVIGMVIPFVTTSFLIIVSFSLILILLGYFFYHLGIKKWNKNLF